MPILATAAAVKALLASSISSPTGDGVASDLVRRFSVVGWLIDPLTVAALPWPRTSIVTTCDTSVARVSNGLRLRGGQASGKRLPSAGACGKAF